MTNCYAQQGNTCKGRAAEDVQPNFSAALKVEEKGEGS